jgi:hypothetical protein
MQDGNSASVAPSVLMGALPALLCFIAITSFGTPADRAA